ncbi:MULTISPECIES: amidase [Halomonadaceae]|uniref:Asp-tRNA(Asn)/Glu-tRNA(Gln) amidotransferase subunit GatA n=2 Tax=Vreelandella TaxID=3137766 RepID=A0A7Z0LQT7_9GAMM|nr:MULTISPECIES: amidase [Halomonas]AJY51623.1 Amidase [Halomonas sp. KO116]NYS76940.1 Asp-tRNA(Asn)/Glu-tRNA(Gln) amidotransferase subunit GatA [Halomonas glaciei]|tara:strand:- start:2188 stop:3588 length:1401 start_codon:yes stop_codon:yes gene_type:complete
MSNSPSYWPLHQQVAAIASGDLSARDLVLAYTERLEAYDSQLATHVTLSNSALEEAAAIDKALARGEKLGPLAGACISVKDNYLTHNMPTRAGTDVAEISFPETDSHVVAKLRKAGAIILGKTRMHEFAWGNITPPTRNPWNTQCVPGGSSGGSAAAVAAGLCSAAMGSDTGGSVRIPATLCGTVGLKPTFGLVGRTGIVPHSWSLDHAGPLTRTVTDAALILEALVGSDADDPASLSAPEIRYQPSANPTIKGFRIGVIRNHFSERISADVADNFATVQEWLKHKGVEIQEFDVPNLDYGLGAIFAIELASSSAYHEQALQSGLTSGFQSDVRDLVEMGRLVSAVDYLHAEQLRSELCKDFARIFNTVDLVISPTSPITAWNSGQWELDIEGSLESVLAASWRFTYPFNLTGMPAISVPSGFDGKGLPIGLQIAGPPLSERKVLTFAAAFEAEHPHAEDKPVGFN